MRRHILGVLGLCTVIACGCNMADAHVKQFDLMRGMATDVAQRLDDGSMGQFSVSGQGLNPGITVEACVKYVATARYDGLAGQFSASAQGAMGSREFSEDVLKIINDESLSDQQRTQFLRDLFGLDAPAVDASTNGTP